jgi:hypothetical protein
MRGVAGARSGIDVTLREYFEPVHLSQITPKEILEFMVGLMTSVKLLIPAGCKVLGQI